MTNEMLTSIGEHQKSIPERTIGVGEWFNPFLAYEDFPYQEINDRLRVKSFTFNLKGVGGLEILLTWVPPEERRHIYSGDKSLFAWPFGAKISDITDIVEEEKAKEARLLYMFIKLNEDLPSSYFPYAAELILPDGEEAELISATVPTTFFMGRTKDEGEEFDNILIPEAEAVLEKVQMRFLPEEVIEE